MIAPRAAACERNQAMTTSQGAVRPILRVVRGQATQDGAGVRLSRVLGTPSLPMVDPFLMLDEFRSDDPKDYIAGFPAHPHRGFETVTVVLEGNVRHEDSVGNRGDLVAGSVQWMTAGRGIVHSEMPQQREGRLWGFQLWVNLPARDKMSAPRYQDLGPERIPVARPEPGATVRVIAGESHGVRGPVGGVATDPILLDVRLAERARIDQPLPESHAGFVYVYEGSLVIGDGQTARRLQRGELGVLGEGTRVQMLADDGEGRALLVAGRPIGEPVARYGPFVMNTAAEIEQALRDYERGALGR
jgi:redox-sensitive bicupin YhaK (pirin superfamily)